MDELACSLMCASAVRECAVHARGLGVVLCGCMLYFAQRGVRSMLIFKLMYRILRGYAYGTAFGMYSAWPCAKCAMLCGRVLLTGAECTVRVYTGAYEPPFTRVCAYGTTFGMCSPSGAPLYVCALMFACTAVGMCSSSRVSIVVSTCVCACTSFGMYRPSGAVSTQKCACVCLYSA